MFWCGAYRSGQFTGAVCAFEQSAARSFQARAWDWCFLAMCHHRIGDDTQARFYLEMANRWIEQADRAWLKKPAGNQATWYHWCERVEVHELCREATALIRGTAE